MSANNNNSVIAACNGATVSVPQAGNQVILNGNFCPLGPNIKASAATCVAPFGTTPPAVCQ